MEWKKRKFIVTSTVLACFICLAWAGDSDAKRREPFYWVKKVRLERNILFDDQTLAKVVDLGRGIKMTPGIMGLLVNEVEGFYSSHGHFLVRADILKRRPHEGVLKLRVDETKDIMEGNSEEARAKRAVEKLIRVAQLKIADEMKNEVVEKLRLGYRAIRFTKVAAENQRLAEENARLQAGAKRLAEEKARRETEKARREAEATIERMVDEVKEKQALLTKRDEKDVVHPSDLIVLSKKGKQMVIRNVRFGYFETLEHGKISSGSRGKFKDAVNNVEGEKFQFFEQDRIPLIIGNAFGVQWDVPEMDETDVIVLEKRWQLPTPEGEEKKSENFLKLKWISSKRAKEAINRWKFQDYKGFNLPGEWTLSFYNEGKLLVSKAFTIYKPEET